MKSATLFPFWAQILDTLLTFLTLKNEEYFIWVEIRQNQRNFEEASKRPSFLHLTSLHVVLRESTRNNISISDYVGNFVSVV